jgi:hypothetical protein
MSDDGNWFDDRTTTQDPEVTRQLRDKLSEVPNLRRRAAAVLSPVERSDAPIASDRRSPLGRYVWEQATNAIGSAGDHLATWNWLLEHGFQPSMAHITIVRAVLETACMARWLLDPSVTSSERVRRAVLVQLDDYDERGKFETAFGRRRIGRRPGRKFGDERRDDLIARSRSNGVAVLSDKGRLIAPPGPTAWCRDYAVAPADGGEAAFRLASAFAHGKQWSQLFVERELLPDIPTPTGAVVARTTADDVLVVKATGWAVDTFAAAVSDAEGYVGA